MPVSLTADEDDEVFVTEKEPPRPIKSWISSSKRTPVKLYKRDQSSPRLLYSRNTSSPVKFSVGGEWALKECERIIMGNNKSSFSLAQAVEDYVEEHTTWCNDTLKKKKCKPIGDLRKSIGDGLTLVNIIEIVAGEKIQGIQSKPIIRAQKIENVKKCLTYLSNKGVTIGDIEATDLVDGNLKNSLDLMSNIRRKFDPKYVNTRNGSAVVVHGVPGIDPGGGQPPELTRPTSSPSQNKQNHNSGPVTYTGINSKSTGNTPDIRHHETRQSFDTSAEEILPGIMGKQESPSQRQIRQPVVTTTQLDHHGVSQHGADGRRLTNKPMVQDNRPRIAPKPSMSSPPQTVAQAWATPQKNTQAPGSRETSKTVTVEERLKSLINGQGTEHDYGDGELLLPPPPKSRPPVNPYHGGIDNPGLDKSDRVHNTRTTPPNRTLSPQLNTSLNTSMDANGYRSSYVPSHPDEKWQGGSRGQVLLDRKNIATSSSSTLGSPSPGYESKHSAVNHTSDSSTSSGMNMLQQKRGLLPSIQLQMPLSQLGHMQAPVTMHHDSQPIAEEPLDSISNLEIPQLGSLHSDLGHSSNELRDACNRLYSRERNASRPAFHSNPNSRPQSATGTHPPPNHVTSSSAIASSTTNSTQPSSLSPSSSSNRSPDNTLRQREEYIGQGPSNIASPESTTSGGQPVSNSTPLSKEHYLRQQREQHLLYKQEQVRRHQLQQQQQKMHQSGQGLPSGEDRKYYDEIGSGLMNWMHRNPPQDPNNGLPFLSNFAQSRGHPTTQTTHFNPGYVNGDLSGGDELHGSDTSSMTPPLPPLSPSNTPPVTPPDSPSMMPKYMRSQSAVEFSPRPDLINSTTAKPQKGGMKLGMRRSSSDGRATKKPQLRVSPGKVSPGSKNARAGMPLSDVKEYANEDDTSLADDTMDEAMDSHYHDYTDPHDSRGIKSQLDGLETMYHEILKMLGVEKNSLLASRRKFGSNSTINSSRGKGKGFSTKGRGGPRDKAVNKRFARLESHVVTLARSVAHLSSEIRTQNTMYEQLQQLKRELAELKEQRENEMSKLGLNPHLQEWERFRGWVPSLTNPKRVNKLTRFFGTEPPLLQIFLKRLGYEKYYVNFEKEKIGMVELPYMDENRLQSIGIPLGPRLRILQESQLCFRQENFNIYIV